MTEKRILASISGFGGKTLFEQETDQVHDPLQREFKEHIKASQEPPAVPESTTGSTPAEVTESPPPAVPQSSATEIFTRLSLAGDDLERGQIATDAGLDPYAFYEGMSGQDYLGSIETQLATQAKSERRAATKNVKQANITGAAAVIESGASVGDQSEGTLRAMDDILGGKHGSLSNPALARKLKELNESMGAAKGPEATPEFRVGVG